MSKIFYTAFGTLKYIDNLINIGDTVKNTLDAQPITYGQSLKDSQISYKKNIVNGETIDGIFNWTDPLFKPNVGTYIYDISFTPVDSSYNFKLRAKIEVKKFSPDITDSSATTIKYLEPLEKSIISNQKNLVPGKYIWENTKYIPRETGTNNYNFYFRPNDTKNYKITYGKINVDVSHNIIIRTLDASYITYGQSLKDSTISNTKNIVNGKIINGSFNWVDPSLKPPVGIHTFNIIFTPFVNSSYTFQLKAKITVLA